MGADIRIYLVDVHAVSSAQRDSVAEAIKPYTFNMVYDFACQRYFAFCNCGEISFGKLSLPVGCTWKDVTGYDVMKMIRERQTPI